MVRILLRAGRCPKAAGDPSRLRSEVKILWGNRDQWARITHVNSWSMYFVLVRWSILEFGMMLHADQRGFNGSLVDVCGCRIGNSHFWKLNQGGFRCLRWSVKDGAIYTSTAHCFCMLFDTLFYLNLLRHCQRLTHYCNVATRIGCGTFLRSNCWMCIQCHSYRACFCWYLPRLVSSSCTYAGGAVCSTCELGKSFWANVGTSNFTSILHCKWFRCDWSYVYHT